MPAKTPVRSVTILESYTLRIYRTDHRKPPAGAARTLFVVGDLRSHMSVSGLCEICESAQANHRCERCGTLACAAHYDTGLGVCTECAEVVSGEEDVDRGSDDVHRI